MNTNEITVLIVDNTIEKKYSKYSELAKGIFFDWIVKRDFEEAVPVIKGFSIGRKFMLLLHANGREEANNVGWLDAPFSLIFSEIKFSYISENPSAILNPKFEVFQAGKIRDEVGKKIPINIMKKEWQDSNLFKNNSFKENNYQFINDNNEINKDDLISDFVPILKEYTQKDNSIYLDFEKFITFLGKGNKGENWLENLLNRFPINYQNILYYKNNYWNVTLDFYNKYFSDGNVNKFEINWNNEDKRNVHYNDNRQWIIKVNLFKAFIKKYVFDIRFLKILNKEEYDDIVENNISTYIRQDQFCNFKRLVRLFVLHEAFHKIHGINEHTVNGIGYHPRIVEEADYQADTFVIISEFFYTCHSNIEILNSSDKIVDEFIKIIRVAINTTMSFAGKGELNTIQVRRFQRYTIWVYIIALLKKCKEDRLDSEVTLGICLDIFSSKPILDVYGLETVLEKDPNADTSDAPNLFCFNLSNYDKSLFKLCYFYKNKVLKTAISTQKIESLISGIKESNFDLLEVFINSIQTEVSIY